jgi:hypothetical protein
MKKLLTTFLALFILSTNSYAGGPSSLKEIVDEYRYALEVEWDQQDMNFYNAITAKLHKDIASLNLSGEEVIKALALEVKDTKLAAEMKNVSEIVILNNLSHEETLELVQNVVAKSYAFGANYIGNAGAFIGVMALGVLYVAVQLYVSAYNNAKIRASY